MQFIQRGEKVFPILQTILKVAAYNFSKSINNFKYNLINYAFSD
jgi:hypothetical protein